MPSSNRAISVQELQKGRTVAVHKNWVPNRQATAVCDFCNRRNVPLQKCQDCIINICRKCTSQGTLQKDPRHMLAAEAADSFEWYRWGKEKSTEALPSGKKREDASRVSTPEIETCLETTMHSSKHSGEPSEYPAPGRNLQCPPVRYSYPIPMIHNQRYNVPGLQPAGFPRYFNQHPQVPQYPYYLPAHAIYGYSAGQPIYNHAFPQLPTHEWPSPHTSQVAPESTQAGEVSVPNGRGEALRSFRELSSQPEPDNSYPRVTGGQLVAEVPQDPQAPPRTPVPNYGSLQSMHNNQPLNPQEQANSSEQTGPRQQSIAPLAVSPKRPSIFRKKPQTCRQFSNASEQAIRGSKRSREVAEGSGQDRSNSLSNLDRRPTKKPRHETILRNAEGGSGPNSIARTSKRTSQAFKEEKKDEDDDDANEAKYGSSIAKNFSRGQTPQSRVVKVQVKSSTGVQRLREILGTQHAGNAQSAATQNNLPGLPGSSRGRSTFSSQALKATRLDELLDAAGVQPIPWPAEVEPQVPEVGRSHQYFVKPRETSMQNSMSVLPTCRSHVSSRTDDDDEEAREAAMILLSMRHGH